jgi:hypothetical protein
MYPLAAYLRELRQDWPLHAIQSALSDVDWLPYQHVAVGAVRAALDLETERPGRIKRFAEIESKGQRAPDLPQTCRVCRYPHDPSRPDEHPHPLGEEGTRSAAAAARAALTQPEESAP